MIYFKRKFYVIIINGKLGFFVVKVTYGMESKMMGAVYRKCCLRGGFFFCVWSGVIGGIIGVVIGAGFRVEIMF